MRVKCKRQPLSVVLGAIILAVSAASSESALAQNVVDRTWESHDGNYSVKASLVDYDTDAKLVTLKREDGVVIEVDLDKLSSRDQSYVEREIRRRAAGQDRAQRGKSENPFKRPLEEKREEQENRKQAEAANSSAESHPSEGANRRARGQSAAPQSDGSNKSRAKSARSKSLYGIRWYPGPANAMVAARGGESPGDDRPIMWFRVLGDLEGFM